jgi:hypothetical protein
MTDMEDLLSRIRSQMDLDSETERELLVEIQGHLEEAVAEGRAEGLSESEAVAHAAARFGLDEVGPSLQAVHAGESTADAVIAAGLPVVCALVLRWLVFAPDGTAVGWPQLLGRPAIWIVALAVLFIPILRFERWRYALVTWIIFWGLTVAFVALPAIRW